LNNEILLQRKYYKETAKEYDLMHNDNEHVFASEIISNFIQTNNFETVLDLGCGTGSYTNLLFNSNDKLKLYGIDPVLELLNIAKNKCAVKNSFMNASGENLPFKDKCFDATCEFAVLHHVPEPDIVVREMIRVSRNAIFLSDSIRFGQGRYWIRWFKLITCKLSIWKYLKWVLNGGRNYMSSKGDGISYSYSVYDSYKLLSDWADFIILLPTEKNSDRSWFNPLLTSGHVLLCAFKNSNNSE